MFVLEAFRFLFPIQVVPLAYYYILHGTVYQAPDLMSVISARLQTASHYLDECLESGEWTMMISGISASWKFLFRFFIPQAFDHYKYHPSKDYYWDFNPSKSAVGHGNKFAGVVIPLSFSRGVQHQGRQSGEVHRLSKGPSGVFNSRVYEQILALQDAGRWASRASATWSSGTCHQDSWSWSSSAQCKRGQELGSTGGEENEA